MKDSELELSDKAVELIVDKVLLWGPWSAAFLVFMVFGMKHMPAIITALGAIWNERHKTKLSHSRSMLKIENQLRLPSSDGKETKK